MTEQTKSLVSKIKAELSRLECLDSGNWTGIIVNQYPEDVARLPKGWVSIGVNGEWTGFGPAEEVLSLLDSADPADFERQAEQEAVGAGWLAAHHWLAELSETPPTTSRDWPIDLFTTEQIEEGTCNDDPYTLIRIETNGGPRWACGPHGVSNCALSDAFDYDCLCESREEALDSMPAEESEEE